MIGYGDFILNEAKVDEIREGDYVYCDKNYRKINYVEGKLARIEKIVNFEAGKLSNVFWTLKVIKKDSDAGYITANVYWKGWTDTFVISKTQAARSLIKLTPDEAEDFKKGKIVKYEPTQPLEDIIKDIKLKVKKHLIDVAYVSADKEKNDMISYLPVNRLKEVGGVNPLDSKLRQTMKVSKFFRKLDPNLTDQEIDKLITRYKLAWEKIIKNISDNIRIVTGEDIRYWYHGKRYGRDENGGQGDLGGSCMQYAHSQKRFDIYCENTDKIAMAIITNDKGELMVRVLIWKLDDGKVYMDRIYAVNAEYYMKMADYCKQNKMEGPWVRDKNGVKRVTLKRDYGIPHNNPFMDTFKFFDPKTFTIYTPDALAKYNINYNNCHEYTDHD